MGNGASSLPRIRKLIILRAYNKRKQGVSLKEQLLSISTHDESTKTTFVDMKSLASLLDIDEVKLRPLPDKVSIDNLVAFLETGKPMRPEPSEACQETRIIALSPPNNLPKFPVWKKREIFFQERIVEYTTIDSDGTHQKLIETETIEDEITHMECKQTGEFSHRESSRYAAIETFNNETVSEEIGDELYTHLKSTSNEMETYVNNMPPGRRSKYKPTENDVSPKAACRPDTGEEKHNNVDNDVNDSSPLKGNEGEEVPHIVLPLATLDCSIETDGADIHDID